MSYEQKQRYSRDPVRRIWLAQGQYAGNPKRWTTLMNKEHQTPEAAESMVQEYMLDDECDPSLGWLAYRVVERSDKVIKTFSSSQ